MRIETVAPVACPLRSEQCFGFQPEVLNDCLQSQAPEYTRVLCGFALQNAHILRFFLNSVVFCYTVWYNIRNT